MMDLLEGLCQAYGPSGHEGPVRDIISEEISPYVDEVKTDALGNLVATMFLDEDAGGDNAHPDGLNPANREGGVGGISRVMLVAHMDEVGVVVTHIDENGFVRFAPVGSVEERFLPGRRVRFAGGAVGVIGVEPVEKPEDIKVSRMFVDIGARAKSSLPFNDPRPAGRSPDSSAGVRVGDAACFDGEVRFAGCGSDESGNRVVSKALDDRAGCAVLIESAKRLHEFRKGKLKRGEFVAGGENPVTSDVSPSTVRKWCALPSSVWFVFTVQAQLGPRGAKTSAFALKPDAALVVDVTPARDTPEDRAPGVKLGAGPGIRVKDARFVSNPSIRQALIGAAENGKIPYQMEVLQTDDDPSRIGGTDAAGIQLIGEGVPTGMISIPARYVHTPSEMVDLDDLRNTVELILCWMLKNPEVVSTT